MTLAEIREFAQLLYGSLRASEFDPVSWNRFINEAQDIFCDTTACLDEPREMALVNGAVDDTTTVALDTPGTKYIKEGDVLDFLDGSTVDATGTVASITSTTALELAANATISDNAKVFYEDQHGYIDIVDDQIEYTIPEGVVLRSDQPEPFELFYCADSSSERELRFSAPSKLGLERGPTWRSRPGTPTTWYMKGTYAFGIYPVLSDDLTNGLRAKWARAARPLIQDDDVSEVSRQYHRPLAYFAAAQIEGISGGTPERIQMLMSGFTGSHGALRENTTVWRSQGRMVQAKF